MKYDEEKSSPSWHPYRYQVTDSSVMKSKQIFFTLSPDGLTQFALDNTTFIDLNRSDNSITSHLSPLTTPLGGSKMPNFTRKLQKFKLLQNSVNGNLLNAGGTL